MPKLSVIVTGRNDDYGGDFNRRLQNMVQWLGLQTERYRLPAEFVFVNYNPLPDKPPMRSLVAWNQVGSFLSVRIITVPPQAHAAFYLPEVRKPVNVYEFAAKNAGIRRAKGDFILSANADLVFDPRLVRFLADETLDPNAFYRVPRIDFRPTPLSPADAGFLSAVRRQSFKFYIQGYNYPALLPFALDQQLWGWEAANRLRVALDKIALKLRYDYGQKWAPRRSFDRQYHVNAAGDFTLMHRNAWFAVGGYPENVYSAVHTDALLIFMAVSAGLRQRVIPYPIYHQDHPRRFPLYVNPHDPELSQMYDLMQEIGEKTLKRLPHGLQNPPESWGFGLHELFEETITG